MKLASTIFVLVCLSAGCRDNALSEKNLTHITVVRNADKQTVTTTPTETPARVDNYPVGTMPEPAPRATYHIIVASYKAADKAKAERLVARLRERTIRQACSTPPSATASASRASPPRAKPTPPETNTAPPLTDRTFGCTK